MGRILIKPYINDEEQIAHGMVDKEYGSVSKKFKSVVEQLFVEYLNKGEGGGLYYRHGAVYGEGKRKILLINKNTPDRILIKNLEQDIISLKDIIDKGIEPSEQVQLAAVKTNGRAIKWIENPSEQVQLLSIE